MGTYKEEAARREGMSYALNIAKKKGIKVAHLVAGTRSFDMKMPKEVNRMISGMQPTSR